MYAPGVGLRCSCFDRFTKVKLYSGEGNADEGAFKFLKYDAGPDPGKYDMGPYTRFSHYRVAPGDRIRRPEQPN